MLPFFIITGYIFVGITCMPLAAKIAVIADDSSSTLRRSDMPTVYLWSIFWPIFLVVAVLVSLGWLIHGFFMWVHTKAHIPISADSIYESLERVSRRNQ